jgi:hypothetical protein
MFVEHYERQRRLLNIGQNAPGAAAGEGAA